MRTSKQWDSLDRLTLIEHERLVNITAENPATISSYRYRYNLANQRYRVDEADGSYWVYGYDDLGQVTGGVKHSADDTPLPGHAFGYGYDDIGNRKTATTNGRTETYTPNELNQYEQRTVPGVVDVLGTADAQAQVFVNRQPATRKDEHWHAEVSADNSQAPAYPEIRVDTIKPGAGPQGEDVATTQTGHAFVAQTPEAFGYDDDGNMTNDGRWVYTWNGENRLVAMETAATAVAAGAPKQKLAFAYDHIGRRTTKRVYAWDSQAGDWALTKSIRFLYDGWDLLAELEPEGYEVGEGSFVYAVTRSYVWGLDLSGSLQGAGGIGGLLFATSGSTTIPTCDGDGNAVQYVGSDTSIVFSCEYTPFGRVLGAQGNLDDASCRFSSKYADEIGLLYFGYRYYDCARGRWLSRDPINEAGGNNLPGYCHNRPPGCIDPLGQNLIDLYQQLKGIPLRKAWMLSAVWNLTVEIGPGQGGFNFAFFPDSCELAAYLIMPAIFRTTFIGGTELELGVEPPLEADPGTWDRILRLLRDQGVGSSIGAAATIDISVYEGHGTANAASWAGYFYTFGVGAGLVGGVYWSPPNAYGGRREGISVGLSVPLPLPKVGVQYAGTWYQPLGNPLRLTMYPGGKCLCHALTLGLP